jgi:ubiquinone/menaquinone biosynthesis C-methylase UbiE
MSAKFEAYVLGNTSEEYQRLRMQALAWEEATRRAITKAKLKPGARCLDVGCGPGEVMRLLAEMSGPESHVTGVDRDETIGTEALATLKAVYGNRFAFHQMDLASDAAVPGSPYDFIFARFVVFHQTDPVALIRKLWNETKPGGALLVMDADIVAPFSTWPQWAVPVRDFIHATLSGAGLNLETGRMVPEYFEAAGVGACDGLDVSTLLFPGPEVATFMISVATSLLPAALKLGTTTPSAFEVMVAAAKAAGANEKTLMYWPLVVATWKTKSLDA